MKTLIVLFIVLFATNALAWTTYPFQLGWSQVAYGNKSWKYWHASSKPARLRNHHILINLYLNRHIRQVILTRKDDGTMTLSGDELLKKDEKIIAKMKTIIDVLQPFMKEAGLITIGYDVPIQTVRIFFHSKHDKNRQLYERVVAILNKHREQLIESGKYQVDAEIKLFLDGLGKSNRLDG